MFHCEKRCDSRRQWSCLFQVEGTLVLCEEKRAQNRTKQNIDPNKNAQLLSWSRFVREVLCICRDLAGVRLLSTLGEGKKFK